jgi:ornithine decarboxylase
MVPEAHRARAQAAKELGIDVAGVSFHVGSGATNPAAFSEAIALAASAFAAGAAAGHGAMTLLDIGGGFCGGVFGPDGRVDLGGVPAAVNAALAAHFPLGCGVRVIAEPGRYFAEAAATLACLVYGVRDGRGPDGSPTRDYWITDGLYGSMNSVLYDHAELACRPLGQPGPPAGPLLASTVFGPTCDGLDTVLRGYGLPRLDNGDWLVFPKMGAYTRTGASAFNGFDATAPHVFYVFSQG